MRNTHHLRTMSHTGYLCRHSRGCRYTRRDRARERNGTLYRTHVLQGDSPPLLTAGIGQNGVGGRRPQCLYRQGGDRLLLHLPEAASPPSHTSAGRYGTAQLFPTGGDEQGSRGGGRGDRKLQRPAIGTDLR